MLLPVARGTLRSQTGGAWDQCKGPLLLSKVKPRLDRMRAKHQEDLSGAMPSLCKRAQGAGTGTASWSGNLVTNALGWVEEQAMKGGRGGLLPSQPEALSPMGCHR